MPDRQKARRRRRYGVVHETVGELVSESATQLGRERNGSSAQTHDSMGPIEARAGNTRTRHPKAAPECQTFQTGLSPGAGVQRRRFLGEEATGKGAVGVGVLVAARGVEAAGVVAAGAWRVGDELARGVEAVVGGEGGGVAGEEGGSGDVGGGGAVGVASGALDPDEVAACVGDEEEGLGRGAQAQRHEVLAGTGGGAGDHRGLGGSAVVEGREAVVVP